MLHYCYKDEQMGWEFSKTSKNFDQNPEIRVRTSTRRQQSEPKQNKIQMGKLNIINTYHRTYWETLTHLEKQIKNKQNNKKKNKKSDIPKMIQLLELKQYKTPTVTKYI